MRMAIHPIDDFIRFFFISAEKPVPNNEKFTVVFIQILKIDAVVYAVVRRGSENKFNPTPEFGYKFGMVLKRNKQMKGGHHINIEGRKSYDGEGPKKEK